MRGRLRALRGLLVIVPEFSDEKIQVWRALVVTAQWPGRYFATVADEEGRFFARGSRHVARGTGILSGRVGFDTPEQAREAAERLAGGST